MNRLPRFICTSLLAVSGCSTTTPQRDPLSTPENVNALPDKDLKQVLSAFSNRIDRGESNFEETDLIINEQSPNLSNVHVDGDFSHLGTEIPIELNNQVRKWMRYFTKEDPERFARFVNRGQKYRKMIESILAEHGVPKELYYLAFIESGFATQATSHASAVGVWQFIRGTGVRYGLAVNDILDERRDPVLATHAAAMYLGDLYRVYQSWYLAMASYNAGEARIMNAIMKSNTRDFWQLVQKRALPNETMNYIPKFIAAVIIGEHLEKYGFVPEKTVNWLDTAEVKVPSYLRLSDIAKTTGVAAQDLEDLNPALRRKHTVATSRAYNLRIWQKDLAKFNDNTDALAALPRSSKIQKMELQAAEKTPSAKGKSLFYRVKRGDNLDNIARAHGMSVRELKAMNQLRSSKVLSGQKLLVSQVAVKNYRVRRGDNLRKIADRFGMSVKQLKNINRMSRNVVYAGQLLTVNSKSGSDSESL